MTEFRKTTALVDEVEKGLKQLQELEHQPGSNFSSSSSLELSEEDIEQTVKKITSWMESITEIEGKMQGFIAKAEEKDPDKKIYGPGMIKRVKALAVRAEALRPTAEKLAAEWEEAYEPFIQKRKEKEMKHQEELLKRKRQQEQQEEMRLAALRAKQLAEATLREAEERRAEEEKKRQELERKRELELERKRYEEQKIRLNKEEERRKKAREMSSSEALQLMRDSNNEYQLSRMLMTLRKLIANIVNDPGVKMYRRIRQANKHVQSELLRYPGGEDFLLAIGFRLRRIKVDDKEPDPKVILKKKILLFYNTFAPRELPKVDVPRVVDFFAGGKEAGLWDRLRKKYGKSEEDLPDTFEDDRNGQLFYVLDEPPVNERSRWQRWFDDLKAVKELIRSR
mmetsp:Transcript_15055/g.20944  ORF Transcript_15055/g.20944 Transcript_15055/m.20944 type:complete len:396 (-) Transcript_15055:229-1416(-)